MQYFRPVIDTGEDVIILDLNSNDWRMTGFQLMEHSWWLNKMVASVMHQIASYGMVRCAWVGEMSRETKVPWMDIEPDAVWFEKGIPLPNEYLYPNGLYLVNHSVRTYIDFDRYRKRVEASKANNAPYGYIIHPLPLLTVLGNGLDGGGFREEGIGYDEVGTWCGALISIEGIPPADYEEEDIVFIEKGVTYIS